MTPVAIRRAGLHHVPAIAQLFAAYRQFYQMPPEPERETLFIQTRLQASESVILLAEDTHAAEPLGFCQLYPTFCSVHLGPIFVLYDLFVDLEGCRSGIGRALLRAAESHAREHGALRLTLRTAKTNQAAQSLYESNGWQRDQIFHTYSKKLT